VISVDAEKYVVQVGDKVKEVPFEVEEKHFFTDPATALRINSRPGGLRTWLGLKPDYYVHPDDECPIGEMHCIGSLQ
jgi:hypothetical protein